MGLFRRQRRVIETTEVTCQSKFTVCLSTSANVFYSFYIWSDLYIHTSFSMNDLEKSLSKQGTTFLVLRLWKVGVRNLLESTSQLKFDDFPLVKVTSWKWPDSPKRSIRSRFDEPYSLLPIRSGRLKGRDGKGDQERRVRGGLLYKFYSERVRPIYGGFPRTSIR